MWQRNGTIKKPCFSAKASLETFFIREAQSVKIRITYSVSFGNWKQSIRAVTMNVQVEASALNVENDHADALRKKSQEPLPRQCNICWFSSHEVGLKHDSQIHFQHSQTVGRCFLRHVQNSFLYLFTSVKFNAAIFFKRGLLLVHLDSWHDVQKYIGFWKLII